MLLDSHLARWQAVSILHVMEMFNQIGMISGEESSASLSQLSWQSLSLRDEAEPPKPRAPSAAPGQQHSSSSKPVHKVCICPPGTPFELAFLYKGLKGCK